MSKSSETKILMLGVGNGGTLELFNTCFTVQNGKGNFLVDMGGSIEILRNLNLAGIDYKSIKHIFVSHSHTDHILGLFWYFKKMGRYALNWKVQDKINIYCNDVVFDAIKGVSKYILPAKLMDAVYGIVDFHILQDGDVYTINGIDYTFMDMQAKGTKLFGFKCNLNSKQFAFLGDETLNPRLYKNIENFDYVMHEAFCLEEEENIFHAYEKNHSTTKSVSEVMNKLNVKNLILFHTEDTHKDRKKLYTSEAQTYFNGKVFVPDELEIIEIK